MSYSAISVDYFAPYDCGRMIGELAPEVWSADQFRSSLRGLEHTKSILIQYDSEKPMNLEPGITIREPLLFEKMTPIIEYMESRHGEKMLVRAFVAKLPPGCKVGLHRDPPEYACLSRYHWVLQTNSECSMIFRRERFHFGLGEIWRFNNQVYHGAINNGRTDRIHLILDFLKESRT